MKRAAPDPLPRCPVSRGKRRLVVLAALLGAATACGGPSAPAWIDVAAAVKSRPQLGMPGDHTLDGGQPVRIDSDEHGTRLEIVLAASEWTAQELPTFWVARPPLLMTGGGRTFAAGFRLASDRQEFTPSPSWSGEKGFPFNSFFLEMGGLVIRLPKGEKPADGIRLSILLHEGQGLGWGRRFAGQGFQVWPGESLDLSLDVPEDSVLRLATTLEPLVSQADTTPVTWRVLQDGRPVFEYSVSNRAEAHYRWHSIPLSGSKASELSFEVTGSLAITGFMAPVVGPSLGGPAGTDRRDDPRPDIMIFLADTFRADNLDAYGGQLGLTPNIDRLASEGLVFRRAWSVGTFTLPAHVSMFTGVMPFQAGLQTMENALPESMETIAEVLSAAGYRTGAVTDAGIVSRRFSFDQGFSYFDESQTTIESTVERALAFLDAGDGRPTFVFVHSYRAHIPYHVSDETRRMHGERLQISGEYDEIQKRLTDLAASQGQVLKNESYPPEFIRSAEAAPIIAELHAQYLGGVIDLDRGFGRLRQALDERNWFEHGKLIFTSDHGEAFAEHGEIEHGDKVFEEKVRVPLFLCGAGISPGVSQAAASLVDLSPTIAAMASLPRLPGWMGESLLTLSQDRPVFSFGFDGDHTFSIVEGAHKAIGYQGDGAVDRERILGGFDLTQDPGELSDVRAQGEDWPEELIRRFTPQVEHALKPAIETQNAVLSDEDRRELNDLGYGGE